MPGRVQYGDWKDGSAIFKDSKGYYIEGLKAKKYLKNWKPKPDAVFLCIKNNKWKTCKKTKKPSKKTRKK